MLWIRLGIYPVLTRIQVLPLLPLSILEEWIQIPTSIIPIHARGMEPDSYLHYRYPYLDLHPNSYLHYPYPYQRIRFRFIRPLSISKKIFGSRCKAPLPLSIPKDWIQIHTSITPIHIRGLDPNSDLHYPYPN